MVPAGRNGTDSLIKWCWFNELPARRRKQKQNPKQTLEKSWGFPCQVLRCLSTTHEIVQIHASTFPNFRLLKSVFSLSPNFLATTYSLQEAAVGAQTSQITYLQLKEILRQDLWLVLLCWVVLVWLFWSFFQGGGWLPVSHRCTESLFFYLILVISKFLCPWKRKSGWVVFTYETAVVTPRGWSMKRQGLPI